ncbi:hypothetical protein OROHE_009267 [Orobanche hederae]
MDGRRGSPSRRVGMVCHSMVEGYEVKLYLVDIDLAVAVEEEEYALVEPAVRFRFPVRKTLFAVCVLESTVYMFGGYNARRRFPRHPKEKYARKFELSDKVFPNGDLQVKEEDLVEIFTMRYAKGIPKAIPTPDGKKFLVFSTRFRVKNSHRAFELYDPLENSWDVLPKLPSSCHYCPFMPVFGFGSESDSESEPESDSEAEAEAEAEADSVSEAEAEELVDLNCPCFIKVTSYSFVDESHFFMETEGGSFALDIRKKEWATLGTVLVPNKDYFVAAKGEYAITRDMVYVIGDGGFLSGIASAIRCDLRLSAFTPPDSNVFWDRSIVPLHPLIQGEGEEEVCNTCVLQLEMNYFENEARILIDVCRTELITLHTEVSKCLRLRTTIPPFIGDFNLISV